MFTARDQENLVHGHQAAAASKSLNQGARQLAPKTPANRPPKTPFKLPLNDENGAAAFGGGKLGLNTVGRGNGNIVMTSKKGGLADKNAFVTPMGTLYSRHTDYGSYDEQLILIYDRSSHSRSPRCQNYKRQSQSLPDTAPKSP